MPTLSATRRHRSTRNRPAPTSPLAALLPEWRPLLDAAGTNVFLADLDLTLVHANDRAVATLQQIEPELVRTFGVRVADVVGGSIHRFHRDPARVESIVRSPEHPFPHEATFSFGAVTLTTTIDRVRCPDTGELIGYCVVWEDISALRESTAAVQRLAGQLDEAAAAVDQLSASIGEIAEGAVRAAEATTRGLGEAGTTGEAVHELASATAAISDVVRSITAIAEQTNILALNATIEAVRAGDAGRGFGVVANEVKELSRGTAEATGDIHRRIAEMQRTTDEVVATIGAIATLLGEIDQIQSAVSAAVEEQRIASEQLARSVGEAAAAGRQLRGDHEA